MLAFFLQSTLFPIDDLSQLTFFTFHKLFPANVLYLLTFFPSQCFYLRPLSQPAFFPFDVLSINVLTTGVFTSAFCP
jgi:hypothetical protein